MSAKRKVQTATAPSALASYIAAPFVRMIIPNAEEGNYLAEVLELPGCISEGATPEEAYRNVEEAMAGWIGAMRDRDRPIPEPVGAKEYSGNFPLRISTELHRAAALRAMQEEVSLNQWIARAIAAQVAKESLADTLADEVAKKVAGRISLHVAAGVTIPLGPFQGVADSGPTEFLRSPAQLSVQETYSSNALVNALRMLQEVNEDA